jgi:S-formylglutathione hydrolase
VRLIEAGAARGRFDGVLVDQGTADPFLDSQLKPQLLEAACAAAGQPLTLRRQEGYDHSYFFIASFIADHIGWHARRLA